MCNTFEELMEKTIKKTKEEMTVQNKAAVEKAIKETGKMKSIELARKMLSARKYPKEEIVNLTDLTMAEIQDIAANMNLSF